MPKLVRFLKDNDCLYNYLENIKHNDNFYAYRGKITFDKIIEDCVKHPDKCITYPFDWSKTKEGYDFWFSLNKKCVNYIE